MVHRRPSQSGNVLILILLAVVLIGALTAAIQSGGPGGGSDIDDETLVIRVTEVQRYASELERAVNYIMQDGKSETDLRFAHPDAPSDYGDLSADADPSDQVFHVSGGGAAYRDPPEDINDGSAWEFYPGTHIPGIGTESRADLIAVLPNVTQAFCDRVNSLNDQSGTPTDTGGAAVSGDAASAGTPGYCLAIGEDGRFDDGTFYSSINTVDESTFEQDPNTSEPYPAPQACVRCSLDSENHFYHVLLAR